MGESDLKLRTKEYALGIIRLFSELPKRTEVQILGRQLFRSGTSVGAQYREAKRGKSTADFISKIEGSLQGNWKKANIGWNCSLSRDFTRRKSCLR
jgi:23S rRNA-intervening sequence protein